MEIEKYKNAKRPTEIQGSFRQLFD